MSPEDIVRDEMDSTFKVLAGVGHVPMIDDSRLVAKTILAVAGAAKGW